MAFPKSSFNMAFRFPASYANLALRSGDAVPINQSIPPPYCVYLSLAAQPLLAETESFQASNSDSPVSEIPAEMPASNPSSQPSPPQICSIAPRHTSTRHQAPNSNLTCPSCGKQFTHNWELKHVCRLLRPKPLTCVHAQQTQKST